MKKPDDVSNLQRHKADLHRETFHAETIDGQIMALQFERLSREVLIQWSDWIRAERSNFPEPIRLLFDFRGAGAPSRYMVDRLPRIFEDLALPQNTRIACVMDDDRTARFIHNAIAQWPEAAGEVQEFINFDPALQWLQEGLPPVMQNDLPDTQDQS